MNKMVNAVGVGQGAKVQLYPKWLSLKALIHQVGKLSSKKFERTAARRQWSNDKKLSRLLDRLGDVALEYAHRVNDNTLKKYPKKRFSTKEAPVVARRHHRRCL